MVIKDYRDNYLIIIEITLMMNKYKQPKTEWMTKAWEDKQAICKLVEWSKTEGIGLIVIKPQNEIYPEMFYFVFSPETADINKPVEIALVKNKQRTILKNAEKE